MENATISAVNEFFILPPYNPVKRTDLYGPTLQKDRPAGENAKRKDHHYGYIDPVKVLKFPVHNYLLSCRHFHPYHRLHSGMPSINIRLER